MSKEKRKKRVRAKIRGTKERPRLSVFRSCRYIYAQIIDDERGVTLVAASDHQSLKAKTQNSKLSKTQRAFIVGQKLAEKALKVGIKKVVFDRGPYRYHGRVEALAKGARKGGLEF